jgi:hypothetical protein
MVAEQWPHDPKFEGLSPGTTPGTKRVRNCKILSNKIVSLMLQNLGTI